MSRERAFGQVESPLNGTLKDTGSQALALLVRFMKASSRQCSRRTERDTHERGISIKSDMRMTAGQAFESEHTCEERGFHPVPPTLVVILPHSHTHTLTHRKIQLLSTHHSLAHRLNRSDKLHQRPDLIPCQALKTHHHSPRAHSGDETVSLNFGQILTVQCERPNLFGRDLADRQHGFARTSSYLPGGARFVVGLNATRR